MSSRAAFISSCGDPFTTLFVHKLFQKYWYDEVDTFYVNVNNHCGVPQDVVADLLNQLAKDPKVHLIYHPRGIGNGRPITETTLVCREDLVMLLEDDGFIFTPGKVNKCFQQIESDLTDAIGSPRFSCGVEVGEASKKKYNLDYSGYGDVGCNFWPNFFFCKRSDLLKTDLDFGSKTWNAGEYSKELDHTFTEINHGDTFVWACVQLRAMGLRFQSIPQYHASPFEITDRANKEQNWWQDQTPYWIHGGSLSAGWGGYLSQTIPDTSNDSAKQEIETRAAFWTICSDEISGGEALNNFKNEYKAGIENLITKANLDRRRIEDKVKLYKDLMKI